MTRTKANSRFYKVEDGIVNDRLDFCVFANSIYFEQPVVDFFTSFLNDFFNVSLLLNFHNCLTDVRKSQNTEKFKQHNKVHLRLTVGTIANVATDISISNGGHCG